MGNREDGFEGALARRSALTPFQLSKNSPSLWELSCKRKFGFDLRKTCPSCLQQGVVKIGNGERGPYSYFLSWWWDCLNLRQGTLEDKQDQKPSSMNADSDSWQENSWYWRGYYSYWCLCFSWQAISWEWRQITSAGNNGHSFTLLIACQAGDVEFITPSRLQVFNFIGIDLGWQ